jgi:dihydrofolate synthase / folylpolyglutamate synthase
MYLQHLSLPTDSLQDKFEGQVEWLQTLITDPTGARYFQSKAPEARLKEFQEQIARITDFLEFAGNPQASYSSIHVAGTSGKGSVVTMLAAILTRCQLHTGSHVSPYLQVCNEKLQIDGQMISPSEFVGLVEQFKQLHASWSMAGRPFTALRYGEAWTALTFLWFALSKVDWAVIETGVGGRFDPTNLLPSTLAVITNVNLDHTELLGHTLPEIAYHKAGIIKPGQLAITASTDESVLQVIKEEASKQNARLYCIGKDFDFVVHHLDARRLYITVQTPFRCYKNLCVGMSGVFQPINAALAVTAMDVLREHHQLPVTPEAIKSALANARLPGRLEVMQTQPIVILDGAHNPHKMQSLADSIRAFYPHKRVTAIIGILLMKDAQAGLAALLPVVSRVVAVQPHVPGKPSLPANALADLIRVMYPALPCEVASSVREGIELSLSRLSKDDLLLVTGSLYMLGEAREHWIPKHQILQELENRSSDSLL